jgi:flagellar assembly protein FliH
MSSSRGGRIFIGSELKSSEDLFFTDNSLRWNPEQEENYLAGVRERALIIAKEILAEAQKEAAMLKEKAYEQALNEYRQNLNVDIEKEKEKLKSRFEKIVQELDREKEGIFQAYRTDILKLINLAVQKAVTVCLNENYEQILANLLEEALELLDLKRDLVIKVNAQDEELMRMLILSASQRYPALENWQLKVIKDKTEKGLSIDNSEGRVDNTLNSRWKAVQEVLDQLAMNDKS